ncbi:MAG: hypothetical protein ACM3PP_04655, partial [Candidatus Saccharibacteria bacterium]
MHKLRSTTLTVFFIVPLLFLAPFFTLLFDAVPVADDYCKGSLFSSQNGVFQSSPWEFIWKEYWSWSSRWLSILLQSFIIPRVGLTWTYGLALALIALL